MRSHQMVWLPTYHAPLSYAFFFSFQASLNSLYQNNCNNNKSKIKINMRGRINCMSICARVSSLPSLTIYTVQQLAIHFM